MVSMLLKLTRRKRLRKSKRKQKRKTMSNTKQTGTSVHSTRLSHRPPPPLPPRLSLTHRPPPPLPPRGEMSPITVVDLPNNLLHKIFSRLPGSNTRESLNTHPRMSSKTFYRASRLGDKGYEMEKKRRAKEHNLRVQARNNNE